VATFIDQWTRDMFARARPRHVHACSRGRVALRVERLERRLLPSTIVWTGAAGDYLWLTPQNWQGSVLPTPADDAVIGSSTTGLPIIVNGFVWVHSVSSNQTIDLPTGGTLTLSAASSQFSNLILDGGLFDPQPEAVLANSLISGPGGLTVQTGWSLSLSGTTVAAPLVNRGTLTVRGSTTGTAINGGLTNLPEPPCAFRGRIAART